MDGCVGGVDGSFADSILRVILISEGAKGPCEKYKRIMEHCQTPFLRPVVRMRSRTVRAEIHDALQMQPFEERKVAVIGMARPAVQVSSKL